MLKIMVFFSVNLSPLHLYLRQPQYNFYLNNFSKINTFLLVCNPKYIEYDYKASMEYYFLLLKLFACKCQARCAESANFSITYFSKFFKLENSQWQIFILSYIDRESFKLTVGSLRFLTQFCKSHTLFKHTVQKVPICHFAMCWLWTPFICVAIWTKLPQHHHTSQLLYKLYTTLS